MPLIYVFDGKKMTPLIYGNTPQEAETEYEKHNVKIEKSNSVFVPSIEEGMKKLAEDAGINIEELKNIYEFDGRRPILIAGISGKNNRETVQSASLLILISLEYVYGEKEVAATVLRDAVKNVGASINNLSTDINDIRNQILRLGKERSPDTRYKLTTPGRKEALKFIKKIVEGSEKI